MMMKLYVSKTCYLEALLIVPNGEDMSFAKPLELIRLVGIPPTAPSFGFANLPGVFVYAPISRGLRSDAVFAGERLLLGC
jgi:hypothetical protein